MTEGSKVDFGACLKPALALLAEKDPQLVEFESQLRRVPDVKLVQCLATPGGRDFLRGGLNTAEGRDWLGLDPQGEADERDEIQVGESDILRWAIMAELMQLGILAEKALSLVDQGITLRDIRCEKLRPVEELAERRWDLAAGLVKEGVPAAGAVADALDEPDLEPYLGEHWLKVGDKVLARGDLLNDRLEALVKGWLGDRFRKLRGQAQEEQGLLAIGFYDLLVASDFHLAAGNYPSQDGLARLSPTEDFYFDDAFFRCLVHCEDERRHKRDGYPYELVFNGDVLDFAQVVVSGEENKSLQFWAVPPLWLRNPGAAEGQAGKDSSLPGRLLHILEAVHGEARCKEIVEKQREMRQTAGLTVWVRRLTEMERNVERSAVDVRRRYERGPRAAERIEEWDRQAEEVREQIAAQWETLAEEGWEALAEEPALDSTPPAGYDHVPFSGVIRPGWALPGRPRPGEHREEEKEREERVEERWEDRADQAWADRAERERTTRLMHQQRVRSMSRKEALGQLADIYFGHRRFFQGLAWFLAQGNRLVVIRGNHDPHWYWPEVQLAFVGWLKTAYDELRRSCENPAGQELPVQPGDLQECLHDVSLADFEERVDFDHGWYYHREGMAYLEHGGQYDAVNAYRYFLAPVQSTTPPGAAPGPGRDEQPSAPPQATEWLPDLAVGIEETEFKAAWGNVGMPLVNLLEIELPNFDRPGYKKVYLDWLLYRKPLYLFQKLGEALLATGKAMWAWMTGNPGQVVQERHEARRRAYARLTGLPSGCAKELDETRWVENWRRPGYVISVGRRVIPFIAAAVVALVVLVVLAARADETSKLSLIWSLISAPVTYWAATLIMGWLNLGEDYLLEPARRVEEILDRHGRRVLYILFGHDHAHNAQQLPEGGWYLNTGTWMHMYETQRKRLLREEHEYPFVRMIDTHHVLVRGPDGKASVRPRVELLRWNDDARRVEPCETFRGADEANGTLTPSPGAETLSQSWISAR
jgi:hypothetical protein